MNESQETEARQHALVTAQGNEPPRPEWLTVLPVKGMVLFPELVMPITFAPDVPLNAIQKAMHDELPIGLIMQKDSDAETQTDDTSATDATESDAKSDIDATDGDTAPTNSGNGQSRADSLHTVGTVANILRYVTGNDGQHYLVCQGLSRLRANEFNVTDGILSARVEWIDEPKSEGDLEVDARASNLRERALEALKLIPQAPDGLARAIQTVDSAALLADAIAGYLGLRPAEQQQVLETIDLVERLDKVQSFLDYRLDVLRLSRDISQQTHERMSKRQREAMLREQMRSIQRELGEDDRRSRELEALREALDKAELPEDAREQTDHELNRLERIPEDSAEYSMVRTYLELIAELPWSKQSRDKLDIATARTILDEDHYGLDKIKQRILEHLAVHKLNPDGKSPILCFVGPPGVGKTSLGQSIARAMGRKFVRASLGGVNDEAAIRGHRRTYVGALPGNIITHLRKAGTRNPVFMLDEMDKLSASFHGDPAAALLEVLDPEQNGTFSDNYLGVPFDLSHVMFIGTANVLGDIPGPLRDRMEIIELSGYTRDEKLHIARQYLVARRLRQAGLAPAQCVISDDALLCIISDYTREAGLRNLERQIGAVARHVAMQVAEGDSSNHVIDAGDLPKILGSRRFENEVALRTSVSGVATGLAWTPNGGDILFIEASRAPGKGQLILTGQLGDVMKESARAALSLVKARAQDFGIDADIFDKSDIHIHFPAGAIPKDGPSAGLALCTALISLLTNRAVRSDVAMTGEISLRGQVLPIGGLKEKTLAAHQAGIKTVLLPERNRKDEDDIPEVVRRDLEIKWIRQVDDGVLAALEPATSAPA